MGIDKTEEVLKRFDYKFHRKNSELIIHLDFSQKVIVDFSDPAKIKIKDKLVGWNFLTGLLEMNIKNALLYGFIGGVVGAFVFFYLDMEYGVVNLLFYYLAFIFWVLLWAIFYITKAENLKHTLMRWNEPASD